MDQDLNGSFGLERDLQAALEADARQAALNAAAAADNNNNINNNNMNMNMNIMVDMPPQLWAEPTGNGGMLQAI